MSFWPQEPASQSSEHLFYGSARDTLLSNRNTEKLNFDNNYIGEAYEYGMHE